METLISTRRKTTLNHRKTTIGGYLIPRNIHKQRIYEPTYQLTSKQPANFELIHRHIIPNCLKESEYIMPIYDADIVKQYIRAVSNDIKFRIQIQNFDRYRSVVIMNVMEKANQNLNWQVGTLLDSTSDGWTKFQHETPTYIANIFCSMIYWD